MATGFNQLPRFSTLGRTTCLCSRDLIPPGTKSRVGIKTTGVAVWIRTGACGKRDRDYYGLTKCFEGYPSG